VIYELKKYISHPGKSDALRERFMKVTLPIFKRLGMQVLVVVQFHDKASTLSYVLAFSDEDERTASWLAFGNDPEWQKAKAESETNGPLLAEQTSERIDWLLTQNA
jgi:hypothetical protein